MKQSHSLIFNITVFVLAFFCIPQNANAQLADSPWPIFHGNAQHTGLSSYDTSHVDGTVKWIFETESNIMASPVINENGVIYFSADNGYLYAVNKDGSLKWKTKLGTPYEHGYGGYVGYSAFPSGSPTIDRNGNIYITTREQDIVAVDKDGNIKWRFPLNITFDHWGAPVIGDDGTIYVNGSPPDENFYPVDGSPYIKDNPPDGGLYALTPDGEEKWHYKVDHRMFNSPTLGKDGTIYIAVMVGFNDTRLIALDKNGSVAWDLKFPDNYSIESSPTVTDNGVIYLGSFDENWTSAGLFAVTKDKILWHYTIGEKEVLSTPAVAKDGTIYVGSFTGIDKFFAINSDGTLKWDFFVDGSIESSPAISAEGTIYFGVATKYQGQHNFYAMNPDGTVKWKYATKTHAGIGSSPAIGSDGTVYVGAGDGNLYAFGGTTNASEQIKTFEETGICPLGRKKAYKHSASRAVYYVTSDCTKRPFKDSKIFFTYFNSWSDVLTTSKAKLDAVSNDNLGFMPYGPKYDPKYGALVKIVSNPKVYLLLGEKKYWITSETVFNKLKYSWNWIEDVDPDLLNKFFEGSEITDTTKHPDYTLVKYAGSPEVYRLENGKKRHILNEEAFGRLNFRWDRIVTIDHTEVYEDGEVLK